MASFSQTALAVDDSFDVEIVIASPDQQAMGDYRSIAPTPVLCRKSSFTISTETPFRVRYTCYASLTFFLGVFMADYQYIYSMQGVGKVVANKKEILKD
ncbi:MAG: hypothetical protein JKY87_08550, partial [Mariprofundus sp.]|nr:hypothetical protein [Mariprofundus sp.]